MRTLHLLLLVFLTQAANAEAIFFRPTGWAVGTEFPAKPKLSERRIPTPEGDIIFMAALCQESSTEGFSVTRSVFPFSVTRSGLAAAYDGAKNQMLGSTGVRLISEESIKMLGRDARRYIVERPREALSGEVRAVIIDDELYIFMHIRPKEKNDSGATRAFFEKISDEKKG